MVKKKTSKKKISLFKTLFYNEERTQLSRTAFMNFVFFSMAVLLFIISIILPFVSSDITIPDRVYIFVGSILGSGFLQYSYGKKFHKK